MAKHLIIASYDGINTGNYGDSLIWHGTKTLLNSLNISENYVEISSPLEEINKYSDEERPVIFECVNILPHLAKRDLNFPGLL
ncbi:MAG TPA: hypothetical protein VMR37_04650, partial [Rhabdochlamydiaceae bacterium]|nr:hypothetical protein [Rhabdochlamydiaceae bacterium]